MSIFDIYYAEIESYEHVNNVEQKNITTTALVTCEKRERYKYEILSQQIISCVCSLRFIRGET